MNENLHTFAFAKMHALGNDFVILEHDCSKQKLKKSFIREICDRKQGIGCDQLLVIFPTKQSNSFNYRIFNQDGTEVSQCGNGARCVYAHLHTSGIIKYTPNQTIELLTDCHKIQVTSDENVTSPTAILSLPLFQNQDIPYLPPESASRTDYCSHILPVRGQMTEISLVNIGNPHAIIFLSDEDELDSYPLVETGTWLNASEQVDLFPEKINLSIVKIEKRAIHMRTYERGVGLSDSCGSAACAAFICANIKKLVYSPAIIKLANGKLKAGLTNDGWGWIEGPTHTVFTGKISKPAQLIFS